MSFKAMKTTMCVGLCFLGMICAQQVSAASEKVAAVQQTRQATGHVGSADRCYGHGEGYQQRYSN